jgi:hypothetical protein
MKCILYFAMTLFIILQMSGQMVKGFQGLWWGGEGSNLNIGHHMTMI